jgi:membrane protein involved in colicin uptake
MTTSNKERDEDARIKAAEEQNKKAQEEARRRIEEEEDKRLQAQRDAVGAPTSTAGMTFPEAAKATEELNRTGQPPNPFSEKEQERERRTTVTPAAPAPAPRSAPKSTA